VAAARPSSALTIDVVSDQRSPPCPGRWSGASTWGYDGPARRAATVRWATPLLLKELVRNPLDNAIAYTLNTAMSPCCRLRTFSGVLVLLVEDSAGHLRSAGAGLPAPFYRALGVDGSVWAPPSCRKSPPA
jgi:two-component system sensor histidine kinase TctE